MIELITGVVTDIDSHMLLAQSRNHGWWELPGTKLNDAWDDREEALSEALSKKLGLDVIASEDNMPRVATIETTIVGVAFAADVRHILAYKGYAMETEGSGYKEIAWVNPTLRQLGRMTLSPITEKFVEVLRHNPEQLRTTE